jgi:hypothetical protein
MRSFQLPRRQAVLCYEYNAADPIVMSKTENGLCAKYPIRPLICRLYHCRLGSRLVKLLEVIVTRGIWHSYFVMGWIDRESLEDNPFANGVSYHELLLKDFDYPLEEINGKGSYLL